MKTKPSKIYIQCGTNDIEKRDFKMEDTSTRIQNIINGLRNNILAEDGEIIIASLLPRTDYMNEVKLMNDFISKLSHNRNNVIKYMDNYNITARMLSPNDRKHLGKKGFLTLLANIRYIVFGKMPRSYGGPPYEERSHPQREDSWYGSR